MASVMWGKPPKNLITESKKMQYLTSHNPFMTFRNHHSTYHTHHMNSGTIERTTVINF